MADAGALRQGAGTCSASGGMDVSEAKRLRELQQENAELKRMVADQALDIRMLRDVNSRRFRIRRYAP